MLIGDEMKDIRSEKVEAEFTILFEECINLLNKVCTGEQDLNPPGKLQI